MRKLCLTLALCLACAPPAAADRAKHAVRKTAGESQFKSNISAERLKGFVAMLRPDAPTGMRTTTSLSDCGAHAGMIGGLVCPGVLSKGQVVLVWDWKGSGTIDGYRIYRVDGTHHDVVGTQGPGEKVTLFIVPPPGDGYNGKCYAATSYQAAKESDLSNAACVGNGSVVKTVTLQADHQRAFQQTFQYDTGITAGPGKGYISADDYTVGYFYDTTKGMGGDSAYNTIARTALHFDVSGLAGMTIRSAQLKLTVATTDIGGMHSGPIVDHNTSCTAQIARGVDYWWQNVGFIDGAIMLQPGVVTGPDVSYDVTSLVKGWAGGNPNLGMVLLGEDENLHVFTEKACQTFYRTHASLEIEYQ